MGVGISPARPGPWVQTPAIIMMQYGIGITIRCRRGERNGEREGLDPSV